jgi:RHS repeat-associated protein
MKEKSITSGEGRARRNVCSSYAAFVLIYLLSAKAHAGTQVTYFYTDIQGSVLATADITGNVISSNDYRPFGESVLGSDFGAVGFAGHVRDDDVALIYMQQRYYDASIGRFFSVDPISTGDAGLYTYASLNPFRFIDPDGRDSDNSSEKCDVECKRAREQESHDHNNEPYHGGGLANANASSQGGSTMTIGGVTVANVRSVAKDGLIIINGMGPGAKLYVLPDGRSFYAPEFADFTVVLATGRANGKNPFATNGAVGHYGKFDFQRVDAGVMGRYFLPSYTDASNFAVGVYMNGAGYSLRDTMRIGAGFSILRSSNAGSTSQSQWWAEGWNSAASGHLPSGSP